jgi:hypothetical protein
MSSAVTGRPIFTATSARSARTDESITVVNVSSNAPSSSAVGAASTTVWPSDSSSVAAAATAATHSGSTAARPSGAPVRTPIFSLPGCAPTSSTYARSGGGAVYQSPVA